MFNTTNYKKLSLFIILDAYVTRNGINYFLANNALNDLSDDPKIIDKVNEHIIYLNKELKEIDEFLEDKQNIHWQVLGITKELCDKQLPFHKRKIEWFRSVDRYPFDHSVFFNRNR